MNLGVNEARHHDGGAALQRAVDGAHFGDLEQSLPLRRAQIARDGYLALDAVEARGLLAAGARIMPNAYGDAYLRKVFAAGGFKAYEKAHRQALVALAAKCFPRLPKEVAAQVVAFAFHTGYY